jgi:diguanylate cyclase (GGDEF)-like protein
MRDRMQDPRLVLAVGAGVTALAVGVVGVATDSAVLGVVAGAAGVLAATAGVALGARARQSEDRLAQAEEEIERVKRELSSINAVIHEEANRRAAEAELGPLDGPAAAPKKGEHAFDPATGLYDEKYFAVLVQQQVAAARRSLRPVSVVIFEIDAMGESDRETQSQALGVVGDVVRRTLRESDAACRLGDLMVGAILEDTPEAGAVWAAERVRGTLLGSPIGDALTLSAGVACYPTHALGAAELVQQAGRALDEARSRGRDRVELAPDA